MTTPTKPVVEQVTREAMLKARADYCSGGKLISRREACFFEAGFEAAHRLQSEAPLRAEIAAALDMLRWARAALDSGYRSTRAKQEIEKIDAFFAARQSLGDSHVEG